MTNPANRAARTADNFCRMLEHVSGGMDVETVTSHELGAAARQCHTCSETELCESWLDQLRPSDRRAPAFCPSSPRVWARISA